MTAAVPYLNASTAANNSVTGAQSAQYGAQLQTEQANAANSGSAFSGMYAGMLGDMFMEKGGPVAPRRNFGIPTRQPEFIMAKPMGAMPMHSAEPKPMDRGGAVPHQGALPQSPIPGSTDTQPAYLTPDEFVVPRDAATWKGHEYWYKQIDKAREESAARRTGIPAQHQASMNKQAPQPRMH